MAYARWNDDCNWYAFGTLTGLSVMHSDSDEIAHLSDEDALALSVKELMRKVTEGLTAGGEKLYTETDKDRSQLERILGYWVSDVRKGDDLVPDGSREYQIRYYSEIQVFKSGYALTLSCPENGGSNCTLACPKCYERDCYETRYGGLPTAVPTGTELVTCGGSFLNKFERYRGD